MPLIIPENQSRGGLLSFNTNQERSKYNQLREKNITEELEMIKIIISNGPAASLREVKGSREALEKECFELVTKNTRSARSYAEYYREWTDTFFVGCLFFYMASAGKLGVAGAQRTGMAFRRLLAIKKFGFYGSTWYYCWLYSIFTYVYKMLDAYYSNYIMDSKYRFLYMLETDSFNKTLIHAYGARGLAMVRLENLSEDEEFNELAREILIHKENKNSVDDWSIEIDPRVEKGVKIFEIKYVVGQDEAKESCWFKSEEMASKLFESKAEIQSIGIKEFKSKNRKRQTPEEMYSSDAFTTLSFAKLKREIALSEMKMQVDKIDSLFSPGLTSIERYRTLKQIIIAAWSSLMKAKEFVDYGNHDCLCSPI